MENQDLFVVETEDRLETVQLADASEADCIIKDNTVTIGKN